MPPTSPKPMIANVVMLVRACSKSASFRKPRAAFGLCLVDLDLRVFDDLSPLRPFGLDEGAQILRTRSGDLAADFLDLGPEARISERLLDGLVQLRDDVGRH